MESTFEFKFFADNFGTLQFRELPDAPVDAHRGRDRRRTWWPKRRAWSPWGMKNSKCLVRADDAWGNTATGFRSDVGLYLPHESGAAGEPCTFSEA